MLEMTVTLNTVSGRHWQHSQKPFQSINTL
jgi:hypothetical protein